MILNWMVAIIPQILSARILLTSAVWFVGVVTKYLEFYTFAEDLLAILHRHISV
jgi:hypothetical protein